MHVLLCGRTKIQYNMYFNETNNTQIYRHYLNWNCVCYLRKRLIAKQHRSSWMLPYNVRSGIDKGGDDNYPDSKVHGANMGPMLVHELCYLGKYTKCMVSSIFSDLKMDIN